MTTPPRRPSRRPAALDRAAILAQTNFFRGLGESSRRALAEICVAIEAARGDVLFREGDPGQGLFICNRGRVRLSKRGSDGRERVVKIVGPGETFGEVVLFEQPTYPVTAVALETSLLFLAPRRDVRAWLRNDEFRDDFLAMLMRKLRFLTDRMSVLAAAGVETRLWQFLDEQFGDAPRVESRMAKRDVAAAIGVAPETLSRLLARLESAGRLRWRRGVIERPPPTPPSQATHNPRKVRQQ